MTDHDPLCRQKYWTGGDCFDCRLIARVVKREREERERDWAEAYARAERDDFHDPMCNAAAPTMSDLFCDCERVANIRADTRASLIDAIEIAGCGICKKSQVQIEADLRERLRARVEALPRLVSDPDAVDVEDVLALLGGESDD